MGYVDVSAVRHTLPDGRVLLDDVNFRVGDGVRAALVGENGAGKTTLLRIIAGDLIPETGSVARTGGLGVMRQFIGSVRDDTTVQRMLVDLSPPAVREAWDALEAAELALMETDDERGQMAYAHALSHWGDVGGYEAEVTWDTVTVAALGVPYDRCKYRELSTLSGGEQKRLALEALLRGPDEVLLLDEPDNYLDVPGKRWLEERLLDTRKTILFVSHDRELLGRVADRVVTVEGGTAWVHGGGFVSYHEARSARHERLAELRRRWDEEHQRLIDLVRTLQQQAANSPDMANRYHAMQTRLAKFEAAGPPPERPPEQKVAMRLRGGRTGVRSVIAEQLELSGLMKPFDAEIWYGDRVGVLGANGAGKSHFLRLLAGQDVAHTGEWRLGARVVPGFFAQTHAHPEWQDRTPVDLLWHGEPGRPGRRPWPRHGRAAPLRAGRGRRPDVPHAVRAASRRGSRSCCSSCPARRCCCSTSRPTTSTSSPRRRWRTRWRRSTERSWRSPTTAGSPGPSTGSWCSAPTAASTSRREPVFDETRVARAR